MKKKSLRFELPRLVSQNLSYKEDIRLKTMVSTSTSSNLGPIVVYKFFYFSVVFTFQMIYSPPGKK